MEKVYIIFRNSNGYRAVVNVFTSRQTADAALDNLNRNNIFSKVYYSIEEHDISQ